MRHEAHLATLEALFKEKIDDAPIDSGLTADNMVKNYKEIKSWLDQNIKRKNIN